MHPLRMPEGHQPRASAVDSLASWWQTNGSGLVMVLGIAGCGKTAFAAHFLDILRPQSEAEEPRLRPVPDTLFVFSFRALADPAACRARLKALLPEVKELPKAKEPSSKVEEHQHQRKRETDARERDEVTAAAEAPDAEPPPDPELPPEDTLLNRVRYSSDRLLMVLDALDVLQVSEPRSDEAVWRVADSELAELIAEAATGMLANVALVITTRLPLLDGGQPGLSGLSVLRISLDRFANREDSIQALRRQKLLHSDALLDQAAEACADHPLVLTAFARATTGALLGIPTFESWVARSLGPTAASAGPPEGADGLRCIANAYFDLLSQCLPDALALVGQLRLFARPVSIALLRASLAASGLREPASFDAALRAARSLHLLVEEAARPAEIAVHPLLRFATVHLALAPDRRDEIAEGLLELLVETPHGEPPSDRHRLDLIEEVLRQSLANGDLGAAWRAYAHHLGGHSHLARCLGDYRRGERVCRALLDASLFHHRTAIAESLFYDWLDCLICLGRLADAEVAYESWRAVGHADPEPPRALELRARMLLLEGRLVEALAVVERHLEEAASAQAPPSADARALRGHLFTLMGRVPEAAAELEALGRELRWFGIEPVQLLAQMAPRREPDEAPGTAGAQLRDAAETALSELRQLLEQRWGTGSPDCMRCHLLAADLEISGAAASLDRVADWARPRGAQELVCWAVLVRGRLDLRLMRSAVLGRQPLRDESLRAAVERVTEGLNIARSCGYGVFHIDLLVTRSRLLLLTGQTLAAEADAVSALEEGVRANRDLGQLEILPASAPACAYRWGEAGARHALAEALLRKAAEVWGQPLSPARSPEDLANDFLSALHDARRELATCRALRDGLGDPQLRDTERVLTDLARGDLNGPAAILAQVAQQQAAPLPHAPPPEVMVSYHSRDCELARKLVEELKARGQRPWFAEDEILAGDIWMKRLEQVIQRVDAVILTVGPSGFGPWHEHERWSCLYEMKERNRRFIPLLLPNAGPELKLPSFVKAYSFLDMRNGIEDKMPLLIRALETPPSEPGEDGQA